MIAPPPVVDLNLPAAPSERSVPELGRRLGKKLDLTASMRGLVLFSHGKGLTGPLVMESVAKATLGRWVVEKDGTVRLCPDSEARTIAERKETAARREAWQATFASYRRAADKLVEPDWPDVGRRIARGFGKALGEPAGSYKEMAALQSLQSLLPAAGLKIRLVAALGSPTFGDVPTTGYALSDEPSPMRRPIPAAVLTAIRTYEAECAAYAAAVAQYDLPGQVDTLPVHGLGGFLPQRRAARPDRVVVRVGGMDDFPGVLTLRARAFASDGGPTMDELMIVSPWDRPDGSPSPHVRGQIADYKRSLRKDAPLQVRTPAEDVWHRMYAFMDSEQPMEEEIGPLLRPDLNEPLDPLVGRLLAAWSEWRGRPVVGWLADDLGRRWARRRAPTLALVDEPGEGVRVMIPDEPIRAMRERTDRKTLAWGIAVARDPEAALEDRARLAFLKRGHPYGMLHWMTDRMARRVSREILESPEDPTALALYGALTPEERRRAREGGIRISEVKAGGEFLRRLYAPDARVQAYATKSSLLGGRSSDESDRYEPTVRWPDAPPLGARLEIAETTESMVQTPVARAVAEPNSSQYLGSRDWTPFDFGQMRASAARDGRADTSRARWGTRRSVQLIVRWDAGAGRREELKERRWRSLAVPLAELPAEIRAEIARGAASVGKRNC